MITGAVDDDTFAESAQERSLRRRRGEYSIASERRLNGVG